MDARKLVLITLASIKICYILIESKASYFINLYVKLRFYLNIVSFNVLLTVLESYDYFHRGVLSYLEFKIKYFDL